MRAGWIAATACELAWVRAQGRTPTVVFLPGFASDMRGTKAEKLAAFCAEQGQAMLRFDYSGHGASGGAFANGTIGRWTEDALAVIDSQSHGALLLVGSSMGGWIALLAALARPGRVAGLLGIAAAPDFTETLMWDAMLPEQRAALMHDGSVEVPSEYGEPTVITRALIEDGRAHLLMRGRSPSPAQSGCCTGNAILMCPGRRRCGSPAPSPAPTSRSCW